MKYFTQAAIITLALLLSQAARADTTLVTPQARLTSVMSESGQALLQDTKQGTYVVVKVGDLIQGFRVTSIQRDQIVLSRNKQHYIIGLSTAAAKTTAAKTTAAKTTAAKTTAAKTTAAKTTAAKTTAASNLVVTQPLVVRKSAPASKNATLTLINPYPIKKMTVVLAPPGLRFNPVDEARKAAAKEAARVLLAKRVASVKPAIVRGTHTKPTLSHKSQNIKRTEFNTAVADFTALAKEIQLRRDGKRIKIMGISRGSYFYRLGLRKGDLIVNVDGVVIMTMDDAAALYARLMSASSFTMAVERGKHRTTFRYSFVN